MGRSWPRRPASPCGRAPRHRSRSQGRGWWLRGRWGQLGCTAWRTRGAGGQAAYCPWGVRFGPNPYMASSVNRRTADGGRFLLLPRRYNRTAVDRFAFGYAEGFRTWRQHEAAPNTYPRVGRPAAPRGPATAGTGPAPKKPMPTATPAAQVAGLTPRRAVPVRHWLGGRAASGRSIDRARPRFAGGPGAVPRANPIAGVRDSGAALPGGIGRPRGKAAARCARPMRAPVRPGAPRRGPAGPGRPPARPPSLRGAGPAVAGRLRGEEPLDVKGLVLAEQVVDGPAQPGGQGAQGPGLAVLLLPPGEPLLGLVARAEEQAGGQGVGPLEV